MLLFYPDGKRSSTEAGGRRAAAASAAAAAAAAPIVAPPSAAPTAGLPRQTGAIGSLTTPAEEGAGPAQGGGTRPVSERPPPNPRSRARYEMVDVAPSRMEEIDRLGQVQRPSGVPQEAPARTGTPHQSPPGDEAPRRTVTEAGTGAGAEAAADASLAPVVPPEGAVQGNPWESQGAGPSPPGPAPPPEVPGAPAGLPWPPASAQAGLAGLAAQLGVPSQGYFPGGFPAGSRPGGGTVPIGYVPVPVPMPHPPPPVQPFGTGRPSRDSSSSGEYCALFVALIGEGPSPLGVVTSTSEGQMVRAFHHFTIVDQKETRGRHLTKGRKLEQGAVKISCARSDPNARNCHGYRKFIKRSTLENPDNGYLVNDTIVIRYKIELVVTVGGALNRSPEALALPAEVPEPPTSLGRDILALLDSGAGLDVAFSVDGQVYNAHRLILSARSPMFRAMLGGPLKEGADAVIEIPDIQPPVFAALLHFAYADELPEALEGDNFEVTMAQHLLAAADRFQMERLRAFCEQRLCTSVDVETAATTLALAETNHAVNLKRVCLEFVADNLQAVMHSDGFSYLIRTCPHLQMEILRACAMTTEGSAPGPPSAHLENPQWRDAQQVTPELRRGGNQRRFLPAGSFGDRKRLRLSHPPPPPPGAA